MGPDSSLRALPGSTEVGAGGLQQQLPAQVLSGGTGGTGYPSLFPPSPINPVLCGAWRGVWQSSGLQGGVGGRFAIVLGRAVGTSWHGVRGGQQGGNSLGSKPSAALPLSVGCSGFGAVPS